jgi:hypothetical protein
MSATKKNTSSKKLSKKAVIVTKTKVATKSAAFAGKIKKVNKLLDKTKWLGS